MRAGPTEENQIHHNNDHHDENDNVDSGSLYMSSYFIGQGLYIRDLGHQADAAMASISQMGRLRLGRFNDSLQGTARVAEPGFSARTP